MWKSNLGLINQDKFNSINPLIPLSVISLSGFHCIFSHLTSPGIMTLGNPIFLTSGKDLNRNWFSRRSWAASPTKIFKTTDKHPRPFELPVFSFPVPAEMIPRGLYLVVTRRTIQSWSWWKSLSSQVNSLVSKYTLSPILKKMINLIEKKYSLPIYCRNDSLIQTEKDKEKRLLKNKFNFYQVFLVFPLTAKKNWFLELILVALSWIIFYTKLKNEVMSNK